MPVPNGTHGGAAVKYQTDARALLIPSAFRFIEPVTIMSYTPRSLFRLLEDMDGHRLLLPHIQRPFVWESHQTERLFDSLMRDYPIQTFLLWRTKEAIRARRFMPVVDHDIDLSTLYDLNRSAAGVG